MRHPAFVTTTALACLLLAGCTDDPVGPVDGDVTTPTATVSPTPTAPTPPPLPEAAKEETTEGAIAFVEHYIDLLNYAANTGDVADLRSKSEACSGCDGYADLYERVYRDGGFYRTEGWRPSEVTWSETDDSVGVSMKLKAPAATYKETRSSQTLKTAPTTYTLLLTAEKVSSGWQLISLRDGS